MSKKNPFEEVANNLKKEIEDQQKAWKKEMGVEEEVVVEEPSELEDVEEKEDTGGSSE